MGNLSSIIITLIITLIPIFLTILAKDFYGTPLENQLDSDLSKLSSSLIKKSVTILLISFIASLPLMGMFYSATPRIASLEITPEFSISGSRKVFSVAATKKEPKATFKAYNNVDQIKPYHTSKNGDSYFLVPSNTKKIKFYTMAKWHISNIDNSIHAFTNVEEASEISHSGRIIRELPVTNGVLNLKTTNLNTKNNLLVKIKNTTDVPSANKIWKANLIVYLSIALGFIYTFAIGWLYAYVIHLLSGNKRDKTTFIVKQNGQPFKVLKLLKNEYLLVESKNNSFSAEKISQHIAEYKIIPLSFINSGIIDNQGSIFYQRINSDKSASDSLYVYVNDNKTRVSLLIIAYFVLAILMAIVIYMQIEKLYVILKFSINGLAYSTLKTNIFPNMILLSIITMSELMIVIVAFKTYNFYKKSKRAFFSLDA